MKYVFLSEFLESSSLALWMKLAEKQDVRLVVSDKVHHQILKGIMDKSDNYADFLKQGNIFITDDAASGGLADRLRAMGEKVFGGSEVSDRLENDRLFGQEAMKKSGIATVKSYNFKGDKAFDSAIEFVKKNRARWVVKQNGDAPKEYSTVGKFKNGEDVLDKLADFKHVWTEDIDFDLMEFIDGHEVAVEGWFNGKEWIKDKNKEEVFLVNFEHKKKSDGDTGRTTGETGTLAYRTHKGSPINKELLKITSLLQKIKYVGNVDINMMYNEEDKKFYGLEFTMRFGYPSLNYFQEMMRTTWNEFFVKCIKGENNFLEIDPRWAVVVVIQVPPYPFESSKSLNQAKGQRIYFMKNGDFKGKDDLPLEKLKHTHLYEVRKDDQGHLLCSGDTGYLMTVTAQADSPRAANDKALEFIRNNVYVGNMDYRHDIGCGKRVKEAIRVMEINKLI